MNALLIDKLLITKITIVKNTILLFNINYLIMVLLLSYLSGNMLTPTEYPRDYPWGWSSGQQYSFNRCKRQFFYEKIKAQWLPAPEKSEIERLRELKSLRMILGIAVHSAIVEYLKSHGQMKKEDLYRVASETFLRDVAESSLEETEFHDEAYVEGETVKATERLKELLDQFWDLDGRENYVEMIQADPDNAWLDRSEGYGEFRTGKLIGYARPDLIFKMHDGKFHLISWKTGVHDIDNFLMQLAGNMLFSIHSLGIPAESIHGEVINLNHLDGQKIELDGESEVLSRCEERMIGEVRAIRDMYADPQYRVPKKIGEFPMVTDQNACTSCKYRGLCNGPE